MELGAFCPFFAISQGDKPLETTLFNEEAYEKRGFRETLKRLIDDFAFRYPEVNKVDRTYYYAGNGANAETRSKYPQNAYLPGRQY